MNGDQILSLPGKKRHQMPGVCPGGGGGGGMLKLRFDWYITFIYLIHARPRGAAGFFSHYKVTSLLRSAYILFRGTTLSLYSDASFFCLPW